MLLKRDVFTFLSNETEDFSDWWLTDDKRLKNSTHLKWRWDLRCITEALLTWSIKQSLSNHQEHLNICIETCYKLSKPVRNCIVTPWQPLIKPLHQFLVTLHRHALLKCSAGALRGYREYHASVVVLLIMAEEEKNCWMKSLFLFSLHTKSILVAS